MARKVLTIFWVLLPNCSSPNKNYSGIKCIEQGLGHWNLYPLPAAGSSTDVSEDWEKDFDLDMTEEEVQMALSKIETTGDVSLF